MMWARGSVSEETCGCPWSDNARWEIGSDNFSVPRNTGAGCGWIWIRTNAHPPSALPGLHSDGGGVTVSPGAAAKLPPVQFPENVDSVKIRRATMDGKIARDCKRRKSQ